MNKINLCNNNHVLLTNYQKLKVLNVLPLLRMMWKNVV